MVTGDINIYHSVKRCPLEDVQFTLGEKTAVTDAKGKAIINNINPGVYVCRVYKEGVGCWAHHSYEVTSKPDVQLFRIGLCENVHLKLTADKTKIKKNETVTIVAQLFKHDWGVTDLKQVSFSINGTQKVIADFDIDKEVAIMTLKGSNQGKLQITASAQYIGNSGNTNIANSNELFIQDGHEE